MLLLRTLHFNLAEAVSHEAQNKIKIRSALGDILGISLDPVQWSLACLPARRGGLGMFDPQVALAPVHISSFLKTSAGASSHAHPQ